MILEHHKQLLLDGKQSYIVYGQEASKLGWSCQQVKNVISFYDCVKMATNEDVFISSWDQHILNTFKKLPGQKIAYLQSHFANLDDCYKTEYRTITVSYFARDYILKTHGKVCEVLQNVVSIPSDIVKKNWTDKQNNIVCAAPRRDLQVLQQFMKRSKMEVRLLNWYDRKSFLNQVNDSKFFLSFYKEDAFGLPPIEAMALGTIPIIFTNSTGKDYRIDLQNCILRKPEQVLQWDSDCLGKYNLQKISDNGFQTAKKYNKSKIMEIL